ncbi:hypothetical protein VTL71DRAFT_9447 [Oculimacula yallundae]|uniref:Uncharacterized protein n=1 Tax=Oculimacula yallundae TaxID=86028 RepID=A0ABR4BRX2_9HELO
MAAESKYEAIAVRTGRNHNNNNNNSTSSTSVSDHNFDDFQYNINTYPVLTASDFNQKPPPYTTSPTTSPAPAGFAMSPSPSPSHSHSRERAPRRPRRLAAEVIGELVADCLSYHLGALCLWLMFVIMLIAIICLWAALRVASATAQNLAQNPTPPV